jgi:EAL domain-containing protein (putative c-di-GMP-specific phosphodiesterase class I)
LYGYLDVHFQPVVDLHEHEICSVEALIRPDGLPPTDAFLAALRTDDEFAVEVTALAVQRGFALLRQMPVHVSLSINAPARLMGDGQVAEKIDIRDYDETLLSRFIIEITERDVLYSGAGEAAREAHELGIRVAVDDFGTGESGLTRLLQLPFDVIKVDKIFVERITHDQEAERVIRAIATMARVLRTHSVAEGVETEAQAAVLKAVGIDWGQGWLWHKAMPADDLLRLLGVEAAAN